MLSTYVANIKTRLKSFNQQSVDKVMIDRLSEIVKQFIIDKGLVLYGGLACDYLFRLKGDYLYEEYETPDYDIFARDNVNLAYQFGDYLYSLGYKDVGVVRAKFPTTMRIRVDYIWVIDISYTSIDVPYIMYKEIKIVDPVIMRMELHLLFCYPLDGEPEEDIFYRWKKGATRLNKLNRLWPLTLYKDSSLKMNSFNVNAYDRRGNICGVPGAYIWLESVGKVDELKRMGIECVVTSTSITGSSPDDNILFCEPIVSKDTASKVIKSYLHFIPAQYHYNDRIEICTPGLAYSQKCINFNYIMIWLLYRLITTGGGIYKTIYELMAINSHSFDMSTDVLAYDMDLNMKLKYKAAGKKVDDTDTIINNLPQNYFPARTDKYKQYNYENVLFC